MAQPTAEDVSPRDFFATQVGRLADRLFGTALRFTRNRDEAEDLVAETVARAWAKLGELRDRQAFEAWIRRILSNTFVSEWRHRRASPVIESVADGDCEGFSLFEQLHRPFLLWWTDPEDAAVQKALHDDIERALDALPDAFRITVVLVDVQGHSYGEAAALLGVPIGTVRSRLGRARARLQRELWQHAREAGL